MTRHVRRLRPMRVVMSQPSPGRFAGRFATQNIARQASLQGVALASFGARAKAFAVDGLIVGLLLLLASLWDGARANAQNGAVELSVELGGLLGVVVVVLYFGVSTWLGGGASPGKRLFGIRVISLVHEHLTLWHAIERALGYSASSLEAGFGFLQYFRHPNHQTVHDRIAETIVVIDSRPAGR
jgi:uncharacterized RDD family membrane protein YckC